MGRILPNARIFRDHQQADPYQLHKREKKDPLKDFLDTSKEIIEHPITQIVTKELDRGISALERKGSPVTFDPNASTPLEKRGVQTRAPEAPAEPTIPYPNPGKIPITAGDDTAHVPVSIAEQLKLTPPLGLELGGPAGASIKGGFDTNPQMDFAAGEDPEYPDAGPRKPEDVSSATARQVAKKQRPTPLPASTIMQPVELNSMRDLYKNLPTHFANPGFEAAGLSLIYSGNMSTHARGLGRSNDQAIRRDAAAFRDAIREAKMSHAKRTQGQSALDLQRAKLAAQIEDNKARREMTLADNKSKASLRAIQGEKERALRDKYDRYVQKFRRGRGRGGKSSTRLMSKTEYTKLDRDIYRTQRYFEGKITSAAKEAEGAQSNQVKVAAEQKGPIRKQRRLIAKGLTAFKDAKHALKKAEEEITALEAAAKADTSVKGKKAKLTELRLLKRGLPRFRDARTKADRYQAGEEKKLATMLGKVKAAKLLQERTHNKVGGESIYTTKRRALLRLKQKMFDGIITAKELKQLKALARETEFSE